MNNNKFSSSSNDQPNPNSSNNLPPEILQSFHLNETPYRLVPPFLGKGSYGVCCSAINTQTNHQVALKKMDLVAINERNMNRILREMRILRKLFHENIIKIYDVFKFQSGLYVVLEKMDTDLHKVLYSGERLSERHHKYLMYQILKAVKYIHSSRLIHRDLKPSNILVDTHCHVKICDFNLATYYSNSESSSEGNQKDYTKYVCTRWYRAPELLLRSSEYSEKIDIWSIGCVFAEILLGLPLFRGNNFIEQIQGIIGVLGYPKEEDLMSLGSRDGINYVRTLSGKFGMEGNLNVIFKKFQGQDCFDLLKGMLSINPSKRLSCEQCLSHRYFAELSNEFEENMCVPEIKYSLKRINQYYDKDQILGEIFRELCLYRPRLMQETKTIQRFFPNTNNIDQFRQNLFEEKMKTYQNHQMQKRYNYLVLLNGKMLKQKNLNYQNICVNQYRKELLQQKQQQHSSFYNSNNNNNNNGNNNNNNSNNNNNNNNYDNNGRGGMMMMRGPQQRGGFN